MYSKEKQVRVQLLEKGHFNEGKLFKLEQGTELRLELSNKLVGLKVRLFSNLPPNGYEFNRNKFHEYKWQSSPGSFENDEFGKFISLECKAAGAYSYFFTLNGDDKKESSSGGSNFLIDPKLYLNNGTEIDLNSIQVQTVLTKLLGPLDEWNSRIEVTKNSGYNMIHFR